MPKNTQGGNKHKKYSNKVSGTTKKNKKAFDDLLSDLRSHESTAGIEVGRVVKPTGSGNFEVFYYRDNRAVYSPPISKLSQLFIKFRLHDGRIIDFNGVEHSFTLEIEMLDNNFDEFSSVEFSV